MYEFKYQKPTTVADATGAFEAAEDGRFVAGGQTLIPVMKQRLAMPSDLIDLSGVDGLHGISVAGSTVTIGAMTAHAEVAASADVKQAIPALAYLASKIGDPHVRNRGTLGGSVANNDPAADYPAAVLGLGATIRTDRRTITADDFFTGMFETALEEGELLTAIEFPIPEKAAYCKFENPASRFALAAVFVSKGADGVRVTVTGAGHSVFRVSEMESALNGDFAASAIDGLSVSSDGLNADMHASADYRAHLVSVLAGRAVEAANA